MEQKNELVAVERISALATDAPKAWSENTVSRDRCVAFGEGLLAQLQSAGMSAELDVQMAKYLERVGKTQRAMNAKRAPLTQLFDEIRSRYTGLENEIDPKRKGTVPCRVREARDVWVKKQLAIQEAARHEAERKQRAQAMLVSFKEAAELGLRKAFDHKMEADLAALAAVETNCKIDTYEADCKKLEEWPSKLPETWRPMWVWNPTAFSGIPQAIAEQALADIAANLREAQEKQYEFEMSSNIQAIRDRMPSKKAELERLRTASEEERRKTLAEKAERERKAAEQAAKDKAERERKAEEAAKLSAQKAAGASLFDAAATATVMQPVKAKVRKVARVLNPEGWLDIIGMWWQQEGFMCAPDELERTFRKMITCVNNVANKDGIFIESENVEYVDEVKAK